MLLHLLRGFTDAGVVFFIFSDGSHDYSSRITMTIFITVWLQL